MESHIKELLQQSISLATVSPNGKLTSPRSWGVYEIEGSALDSRARRFRFGNHPIRQQELIAEYGSAKLLALFSTRGIAIELADLLNCEARK